VVAAQLAAERAAVARLTAGGQLDPAFAGSGFRKLSNAGRGHLVVNEIAVDTRDSVVGGGWSGPDADDIKPAVVRLTAAGKPDTGFGRKGVALADIGVKNSLGTALALDGDSIYIGGRFGKSRDESEFVARLLGGAPDRTAPRLTIQLRQKRDVSKRLVVTANCSEDCTLRLSGSVKPSRSETQVRLRTRSVNLDANKARRVTLTGPKAWARATAHADLKLVASDRPGNKTRKRVRRALR
jgi:hypothetical protein